MWGGGNMVYTCKYKSLIGDILLAADEIGLTGLWFEGQKYFAASLSPEHEEKVLPVFEQTIEWLDCYFSGKNPGFMPEIHLESTPFRLSVWEILKKIPYGKIITYKDIAKEIARLNGLPSMSMQAVGNAVGHNPISIIIPCHRVVSCNGSLTGYAGGISKKIELLTLEQVDMTNLFVPKKGTAL